MFYGFLLPRAPKPKAVPPSARSLRRAAARDEDLRRFTVRLAEPADEPALRRLAQLDSARLPEGTLLVGEVGGGIQAAVPVYGGRAIANPFVRTEELVKLLELRAAQLRELGVGRDARVLPFPQRRPRLA